MPVTWKYSATPTWNRTIPICAMGDPTAVSDWSQSYGGTGAVAADGYVFWTRSNRYIDKVDPTTGTILQTRDFGAGSNLGAYLCACDVAGVAHIYCTTAYNTSSALCRAIKTTDLTDYWTRAWTGCPAAGVYDVYIHALETASGVLIIATGTSPYYWYAIRDNGATATYLWTATGVSSGAKSAALGGSVIFGIAAAGGAIVAVNASNGTVSYSATQTSIVGGSAMILAPVRNFGIALIGSSPFKLRKFRMSDGLTPAGFPPDLQLTSTAGYYVTSTMYGNWYYKDQTKVYCYDEWFNKMWEYTAPENVTQIWLDLEDNLYIHHGTTVKCVKAADHSTTLWSVSVPATGGAIVPSANDRLVFYGPSNCSGIAMTRNAQLSFSDDFTRADNASLGNNWTDNYFFSDAIVTAESDTFDRANNASIGNGWTDGYFYTGAGPAVEAFSIETNKVRMDYIAGGPKMGAKSPLADRENVDITVSVTRSSGDPVLGIIARGKGPADYYYCHVDGSYGNWQIRKVIGGTITSLLTGSVTMGVGATLSIRFRVFGNELNMYIAGSLVGTVRDDSLTGAGSVGLFGSVMSSGYGLFDGWTVSEAPDYWSIVSNKAKGTAIAGGPHGGALCGGMPACRDVDVTMTFKAGLAPTTSSLWCGPIFRAVDSRMNSFFLYRPDTGNFEYRFEDQYVAGVMVMSTINWNKPVIANGDSLTLRVVVSRWAAYFWINGQGPYEWNNGFPSETRIGMYAAGASPSQCEVSSFVAYGKSSSTKLTMIPAARFTEIAGAEGRGIYAWSKQIFQAADGSVLLPFQSRYAADPSSTWRRYWTQTTSPTGSFSAATLINTTSNLGNWQGDFIVGTQDPATEHVYTVFLTWGSSGNNIHFVKFTKNAAPTGGWTQGSAVQIGAALTSPLDKIGICRVPGTGRIWVTIPTGAASVLNIFYSDNEGANWTQITSFANVFYGSITPTDLIAWNSKAMIVYKPASANTTIVARERDDTLANKNTWGSEVQLWTGQSSTEGYQHCCQFIYCGTAACSFALIVRTSDNKVRVKKYLEGTGWISGDTVILENQMTGNLVWSYWDGVKGRIVVYTISPYEYPIEFNPADNTFSRGTEEPLFYTPTTRLGPLAFGAHKRGVASTGSVGVIVSRMEQMSQVSLRHLVQLEHLAKLDLEQFVPTDFMGTPLSVWNADIPLDFLGSLAQESLVPMASAGILQAGNEVLFELLRKLVAAGELPLDAMGIFNAIYHRWLAQRYGVGSVPHSWQVLQRASVGEILHHWLVATQSGGSFPHLWRVLPPQIITLRSQDIQLPFGKIEKVG